MELGDVQSVASLFMKAFRGSQQPPSQDLVGYLADLLFSSPSFTSASGSYVYAMPDGRIIAAILGIPMKFRVGARQLDGRIMCAMMKDPEAPASVASEITLKAMRRTRQEFSFNDTASPQTLKYFLALGGRALPWSGLEWRCPFRPFAFAALNLAEHFPALPNLGLTELASSLAPRRGRGHARLERTARDSGITVEALSYDAFCEIAPSMIAHYEIAPVWSRDELRWTLGMAARNTAFGPLSLRAVLVRGKPVGCFVHYGARRQVARVLNVLALPGQEEVVLGHMLAHLDAIGCLGAVGRAQPELLVGLSQQPGMVMRHSAFVGAGSRHDDADAALARGDCYLGGLAGETWSRLMNDFHRPSPLETLVSRFDRSHRPMRKPSLEGAA